MKPSRLLLALISLAMLSAASRVVGAQNVPKVEVAPAHEKKWEIQFDDDVTPEEYARQLEYFAIEVAAISKNGRVEYISQLTSPRPAKRVGERAADPRLRIGWKSGSLHAADRRLLRKAGIASNGRELTHFFSPELQKQLEKLELEYANLGARDIELTRFQIRRRETDEGYEFAVIHQQPPKP